MKIKSLIKHNLMRAAMTLALIMTCATAWAETVETYYIDENGNTQTVTATVLTGSESNLGTEGQTKWYVVNSNISHNGKIVCYGDVRLILADGNTLTVNSGDDQAVIAFPSLTIYGQTLGTGTLSASNTSYSYSAIDVSSTLTINGGTVTASNTSNSSSVRIIDAYNTIISGSTVNVSGAGTAIHASNTLTISGSTVTGTVTGNGIYSSIGNITISGSTVSVTGNGYGIYSPSGNITISGGTVSVTDDLIGIYSMSGNITINSGNITATGNGYGIFSNSGTITINGGTVSINSNDLGISTSNGIITINGGKVTATAGNGISSPGRTITLGWTNTEDFIKASSYNGTVKVANGFAFLTDDTPPVQVSGTVSDLSLINGKKLTPDLTVIPTFTDNGDNTYTIWNATGWGEFCDMLDNFVHTNDNGYCFDGKTVKLGADISITRAAGNTGYHDFTGIFDGQGHTLTVNITDTQNQGTAPFRVISNATIRNLHVTGSVTGTAHAAGLVGKACAGTMLIENCLVEANVNSTVGDTNGNKHCGGIVGHGFGNNQNPNNVNLTLRNCVYTGTITCDKNYIGGLQGWSDGNTLTLENCLFAGNYQGTATGTALFHPIALHNKTKFTNLTATNVFTAVAPTITTNDSAYIAAKGTKTTGRATVPVGIGNEVATYSFMNMTVYQNGILYNGLYYVAPTLSTDSNGAYLISSVDDWTNFCDMLYNNDTWNRFSGKTVKLTASIGTSESPVTRMAGYATHDFCGTFNGQGNTITVSLSSNGENAALFSYISNTKANPNDANDSPAAILNLKVAGTVTVNENASHKYAGGLVGSCWGVFDIENCRVSTVINSHINGDGSHGGIVGRQANGTLTITGCVFDGQMLGSTTNACGGIVGYRHSGATDIYHTLFAPTALTMSETNSATFICNATQSCHEGCYYTVPFGATTTNENAQGTKVYSISKGEYVTTLEINGTANPSYDVSGLGFYSTGIKCGDVLFAKANDVVSLILGCTPPAGFTCTGYTATSGNLNGTTLTMPNLDVTISATMTPNSYTVHFDGNGSTGGSMSDQSFTYGVAQNLTTNAFTLTGYTFAGWNTQANGGGDSYTDGQEVSNLTATNNGTVTLYAQWTHVSYPVTYLDENGDEQQCTNYTLLTGNETETLTTGWYVVDGTINFTNTILVNGDIHIILKDNAVMNVGTAQNPVVTGIEGIAQYLSNINIYGQSTGTNNGQLNIYATMANIVAKGGDFNCSSARVMASSASGNGIMAMSSSDTGGNITLKDATINVSGPICIQAAGNLTINGGEVTTLTTANYGYGINAKGGNLTINDGKVTATATSSNGIGIYAQGSNLTINGGEVTATATSSNGIGIYAQGGNLTINGGEVEATGNNTNGEGIFAPKNSSGNGGNISISNATVTASGYKGIDAQGGLTINSGTVTANGVHGLLATNCSLTINGGEVTANGSYGIYATNGNITISVGQVTANGSTYGIYAVGGNVTISGGQVTANGNTCGIYAEGGNVNISGGEVEATGNNTNGEGILAINSSGNGGSISISNATVTATGSIGIRARNGITINSGTVTANNCNYGIYADGSNLTISGGQMTANGNTCGIFSDNITITSGEVTANGTYSIYANNGNLIISGGQVTANGSDYGILAVGGNITISGGQVTANGSNYGIYAYHGNITLGWTNASDYIYADSYYADGGTIAIATGKAFIDEEGTQHTSGTVNASYINGKTLHPYIEGSVPYIDENGQWQLCTEYNVLNGTETTLGTAGQETWYVADGTLNYSQTLTLSGDVHLILKDNAVMNVGTTENPVGDGSGITGDQYYSISIYAQSMGDSKGQLHVNAEYHGIYAKEVNICGGEVMTVSVISNGIYARNGNITIYNGHVTSQGGHGILAIGDIIINGGQVTSTGRTYGIFASGGNLTINGGQVTANGGNYGIYTNGGDIILGWTNATDFIQANSYEVDDGTLSIASGKAFIDEDGNTFESGTVNASDIDGKKLYPDCVVRKQVAGYEEGNGGWVFIASPVAESIAPSEVHNLIATTEEDYDLYRFNQSDANGKEWQNWKATTTENHPDFTSLVNGQGYLYATKETRTLVFAGEYTATTEPVEVPLAYDATAQLKGWNLVGNPFTTQATMTNGNGQAVSFYVINGQNVEPYEGSAAIEPCTGVMVKAEGTGEKVRFTKVNPDNAPQPNKGSLQIALSQVPEPVEGPARNDNVYSGGGVSTSSTTLIDNAIVSFNEGSKLSKFYFGTQNANIYIPQDNEEYAIAFSESQGEMPLNFKAKENGTYILTISTTLNSQLSTLNYLHLIDNLTGADVDLLVPNGGDARPCVSTYTFTAKTTDYESRFKLVFAVGSSTGSDTFAFFSNGNWIISNEGETTLQVIDVNGRILSNETINGSVSTTINAAPGVYMIRLVNGENVKVQKIVVR